MRRYLANLFAPRWSLLGLVLALSWAASALAAAVPTYRIIDPQRGTVGYVVGTMHSEDARVLALLGSITPLLDEVDVLALELVPDAAAGLAAGLATLLPDGRSLDQLLDSRQYQQALQAGAQIGLPAVAVARLRPWALAVMLSMPARGGGHPLDIQLYLHALGNGRDVVGLETVAEQLAVFTEMPPALQLTMLQAAIKNRTRLPQQLEEMTGLYLAGDLDGLSRFAASTQDELPPPLDAWLQHRLIDARNALLSKRLLALLGRQRVLVAIGALHLPGMDGVLAHLRTAGFAIESLN